jgi:hypothetical protein
MPLWASLKHAHVCVDCCGQAPSECLGHAYGWLGGAPHLSLSGDGWTAARALRVGALRGLEDALTADVRVVDIDIDIDVALGRCAYRMPAADSPAEVSRTRPFLGTNASCVCRPSLTSDQPACFSECHHHSRGPVRFSSWAAMLMPRRRPLLCAGAC